MFPCGNLLLGMDHLVQNYDDQFFFPPGETVSILFHSINHLPIMCVTRLISLGDIFWIRAVLESES